VAKFYFAALAWAVALIQCCSTMCVWFDAFCSLVCLRDELVVSTGRGLLQRLRWLDGGLNTELTIEVASIPFSADLQHSRCVLLFW